jgi:predicted glycosyltransferase/predicted transcriptional regulator
LSSSSHKGQQQQQQKQQQGKKKVEKIWIAIGTPFQANFFAPLINELKEDCDFLVTARNHDSIFSILEAKKIEYVSVGKHGGKELPGKLEAYASTIQQMTPIVEREKPDLLLTERWPEAVRVAFGFNIPSWTIFYDERETHVNKMVFPLASKVFVPRFYDLRELYQSGVTDPEKIYWFNGFHTCYLKQEQISMVNPFEKMGVDPPIVFVRPEPEFASFFPNHRPVLEKAVENLAGKTDASIVVLPRTESQRRHYSAQSGVHVLDYSISECPVMHADVALGAAETMLMEAFVLGKPCVSAIYWNASKPVIELHRHIAHSTDPDQLASFVERLLGEDEKKAFKERASLLVKSMDNPVQLMVEEIRKMNEGERPSGYQARRSRMEILLDIIQATSLRPLKATHIMREANISYNEMKKIITNLESNGLIASDEAFGGRLYHATQDGLKLLEDYRELRQRLFAEQSSEI